MDAQVPDLTFQGTPHFIMLFSILCICEARRLGCVLTFSFHCPLLGIDQYVSQLKEGTASPETNVAFSPATSEKRSWGKE